MERQRTSIEQDECQKHLTSGTRYEARERKCISHKHV